MRRAARIAAGIGVFLAGLVVLATLGVLVGGNTAPGRRLVERLVARVTDGTVTVEGLAGSFPGALRARQVALRDKTGAWMRLDDVRLDWSPLALFSGTVRVERLAAAQGVLLRRPVSEGQTSGGTALPLRLAVAHFAIDRLDLAAAVAGVPARLSLAGALHLVTPDEGAIDLEIERRDAAGRYRIEARFDRARLAAQVAATEPAQGLLSRLAGVPEIGPLTLTASVTGPRRAAQVDLHLAAGPLQVAGRGTIDLIGQRIDVDVTAHAPAMAPAPTLSWRAIRLDAHLHGPFSAPDATAHLDLADLSAGGAAIGALAADLHGAQGTLVLDAQASGLRLPGPQPDLLAAAPLRLHAEARLDAPGRPVTFTLSHPLLTLDGTAETAGAESATVTLTLPDLAPLAKAAALDLRGHARLAASITRHGAATEVALDGGFALDGGMPMAVALFGTEATLSAAATIAGPDITLAHAAITGRAVQATARGTDTAGVLALDWTLALSDLQRVAPMLTGALSAQGRVEGPQQNFTLTAAATGTLGARGVAPGPVSFSLQAAGLPDAPAGRIAATGRLAGAPLQLDATVRREGDGTLQLTVARAQWKSADGEGALRLPPGAIVPLGQMRLRIAKLDELAPFLGRSLRGSLRASLETVPAAGRPRLRLDAALRDLAFDGQSLARLDIAGRIDDPATRPVFAVTATATGLRADGVAGAATLAVKGPAEALVLHLSSELQTAEGGVRLAATATARLTQRDLRLTMLTAEYGGRTLRLLAPARLHFASGISLDGLRLGLGEAVLAASGEVTPKLALKLSLANADLTLAQPFLHGLAAEGRIAVAATLRGTIAAPEGSVQVTGRRLRWANGPGSAIPPASLDATVELQRGAARIEARLAAGGKVQLHLSGQAPLRGDRPFELASTGRIDLTVLDPLLTPDGQSVQGEATLDLRLAGTPAAPRVGGTLRLADGAVQDYVQGVHVSAIDALIEGDGTSLKIVRMTGKAGPGTLSASGTLALADDGPLDLVLTARGARVVASDLLTAEIDADLTLRGAALDRPVLAGHIRIDRADINIPNSLPQNVAVLDVRRPGQQLPAAAGPALVLRLDLTLDAPQQVFVRGRGLDAEMAGRLRVTGTSDAPVFNGGFTLRRGTYSLAGQALNFTTGKVTFDGAGLTGRLDPALDFLAQTTANDVTATLQVTGHAEAPKIKLSSSPELPQDEILARLLFGQSVKQLSPFQLAAIAQAVASLSGLDSGFDPLGALRRGLGLDRLSVSGASGGGVGATVEAGKYVANGVYLGTKQGTSGGTQAQVQIDLTRHLKVETTVGTGGTPATGITPDNDPGSSVGLTYQFEY